jgi:hypothetical protein
MLKILSVPLMFCSLTFALAPGANAEISQRDQERAAQRAYEASARDHSEAAEGFESFRRGAERIRDGARAAERILERMK